VRLLGLPAEHLHVIPHGVDGFDVGTSDARRSTADPYVLVVSAWGPHKGFSEAVAVLDRLVDRGVPHRMIIVGLRDKWSVENVRRIVNTGRHPNRVDIAGYVDDLGSLYRDAGAVLVTSRAEGFGLPALEAMSCGAPVVSFDNTSLPEVVGDAGVLVADGDTDAMADRVFELLNNEEERSQLAATGRRRAANYTWERSIEEHVRVLAEAAGT
jgi:glycosyltransferase involved in cell wall biosynthesis